MKFVFSTLKSSIPLAMLIVLFSCGNDPLDIDISEIQVDLNVKRFDQDLFELKDNMTPQKIEELSTNYGDFLNDFTNNIINIGNINTPESQYHLNAFINDPYIADIKSETANFYSDFSPYKKDLESAFKHYKYYFPKRKVPEIVTYISGYNYAIVTDDTYLGIGLDMFLGNKHEAYAKLGLPQYKTNYMDKENLVPGAVLGWISTEFDSPQT
jgi:hypothetical protein